MGSGGPFRFWYGDRDAIAAAPSGGVAEVVLVRGDRLVLHGALKLSRGFRDFRSEQAQRVFAQHHSAERELLSDRIRT